ncbi:MAG TPA: inositol monophosphatase family protein, partial [Candidatus Dormibacteraeota bacterium]|nr:inositol monophosphatase family protein [Candidatus Dormibacteraeota bacterium]
VDGVVFAPFMKLEFTASRDSGAHANGARLPALHSGDPSRAVVATGFPFRNKTLLPRYMAMFRGALGRFEDLRRVGAAALDLCWTAAGTFDGFFELNLNTWDIAAGALLVREVGGHVTDWSGGETWVETGNILAASVAVHDALLELAAKSPDR